MDSSGSGTVREEEEVIADQMWSFWEGKKCLGQGNYGETVCTDDEDRVHVAVLGW